MSCSPSYLSMDMAIWTNQQIVHYMTASYVNLSQGDVYDCALTSAPCESYVAKSLVASFDTNTIFWVDTIAVYTILPFVLCLGMIGNVVNIVILSTGNIAGNSTNNLLLATSVSDLVFALMGCVFSFSTYLCFLDHATALSLYNATGIHTYVFGKLTSLLSLDFVTVISVQRAAASVFPLKKSLISSRPATAAIITALVVYYICSILWTGITTIPNWMYHPYFGKRVSLGFEPGIDFKMAEVIQIVYISRIAFDLFLLVTSGSVTVTMLKQQSKSRLAPREGPNADANGTNKYKKALPDRPIKTLKLSLGIFSTSFVVYSVEFAVSTLSLVVYRENPFESEYSFFINFFSRIIGAVACSFNFVLYIALSSPYRAAFHKLLRCRGKESQKSVGPCKR